MLAPILLLFLAMEPQAATLSGGDIGSTSYTYTILDGECDPCEYHSGAEIDEEVDDIPSDADADELPLYKCWADKEEQWHCEEEHK